MFMTYMIRVEKNFAGPGMYDKWSVGVPDWIWIFPSESQWIVPGTLNYADFA